MDGRFRSALLAGFIAGFAFMFIANLAGMAPKTSALVGLAFLVVTALVTAVIAGAISGRRADRRT